MANRRSRASRARKPGPVQARVSELVDQRGRVVARLGLVPGSGVEDQGVGLELFGANGDTELALTVDSGRPAVHLSADGTVRLSLAIVRADEQVSTVLIAARDRRGREVLAVTTGDG